jgi:hypothetical protein
VNQTEISLIKHKQQTNHLLNTEMVESQELKIQNLDINLPKAKLNPLYNQILFITISFLVLLHSAGALVVDDYFSFKSFHALSIIVGTASILILTLLSRYTHKVRNS